MDIKAIGSQIRHIPVVFLSEVIRSKQNGDCDEAYPEQSIDGKEKRLPKIHLRSLAQEHAESRADSHGSNVSWSTPSTWRLKAVGLAEGLVSFKCTCNQQWLTKVVELGVVDGD